MLKTPPGARTEAPESPDTHFAAITIGGDLSPYNGPWGYEQAAHLLRRTTFGLKKAQVDQLLALGSADAAVDHVLNLPSALPDPPINNYNNADFTDPVVPAGQTWVDSVPDLSNNTELYRIESWRGWWLNHMVEGESNIREKMTLFWHNHFATKTETVFIGRPVYLHNQLLRQNALGNFKSLVKAVTLDPMMLYFLNGFLNSKTAPDENYARELQELFTIGKDVPNTYTEDDVYEAARILTGWRVNFFNSEVFFNPLDHDTGNKQFSAYYNNAVIPGSINGEAELDMLLDIIFEREEVALFLSRKIYRFFIYYKIDDTIEQTIIEPLAQIMRDNNYEIYPVMEALLKSEHFFDAANKGCYIKTPLDHLVGNLRNFNTSLPGSTLLDEFLMRLYLNYYANAMQMLPGDPPNVAGWEAFRQAPSYYRFWITGDTVRNRNVLTDVLALFYIETENDRLSLDLIAFAKQFSNPGEPNQLINDSIRILLPMDISQEKKNLLKSILLSGQANDFYWTLAWNAYLSDPNNPMLFQTVWYRLALLYKYIMNLPEYQLA